MGCCWPCSSEPEPQEPVKQKDSSAVSDAQKYRPSAPPASASKNQSSSSSAAQPVKLTKRQPPPPPPGPALGAAPYQQNMVPQQAYQGNPYQQGPPAPGFHPGYQGQQGYPNQYGPPPPPYYGGGPPPPPPYYPPPQRQGPMIAMGMGQNGMRPEMIMPIGGGGPPGGPQLAMQMGPDGMRPEMLMPISGPGGPMIAMGMGGRRGSRGGGPEIVMPM